MRSKYLSVSVGCLVACLAPAFATSAHAQAASTTTSDDVVVTASRIVRNGYDAPTPTTVVGMEQLEKKAPPTLIEALTSLPALKNVGTPQTIGAANSGNRGQSFVNLRGIGANRTLVLLDGERIVPSTSIGTVDIATMPSALVERVELVTGGASAAWGSDAVSGVVNFVLTNSLRGIKGDIQGGVSDYGDARYGKVSLAGGTEFAGGKGRLIASAEYYNNEGAPNVSRPYTDHPSSVVTNPTFTTTNGQYRRLLRDWTYYATATTGGLINAGPLRGLKFNPGGSVSNFTFGTISGATQIMPGPDPELRWTNFYAYTSAPQTRASAFARASYDLTPDVTLRFDALYGKTKTNGFSASPNTTITGNYTIRNDNVFLSSDMVSRMATAGVTSFTLGRVSDDLGASIIKSQNETQRYTTSLNGRFGENWKYKVYGEYGKNQANLGIDNNVILDRLTLAIDAVRQPGTGQPICRSTIASPTNGCVPVNLFGVGAPSAAATAWVMGNSLAILDISQKVVGADINGEPFNSWAGPVSVAAGLEYREDTADQAVDAISAARRFAIGNPADLHGAASVKEAFGEIVFPLLTDSPLAKSMDVNAAARVTEYETSGTVTTWKVGLNYSPFEDLRFRATRSRDVRAPNLLELYTTRVQQSGSVTDPVLQQNAGFQGATVGNPNLTPEAADTIAAGVVYRPGWFKGFSASIDYYDISIEDAISTISLQQLVDRCFAGNQTLCALITRDPVTRVITGIENPYLNLQSVETHGVDMEFSYRTPLSRLSETLPGDISLRALGTYVAKLSSNDGVTSIDTAGNLNSAQPYWTWNFSAGYNVGDFSTTLEVSRLGGGKYDKNFGPLDFDRNDVEAVNYLNLSADYTLKVGKASYQFYTAINNLTNKEPPDQFQNGGGGYDRLGRAYRVGLRFKY